MNQEAPIRVLNIFMVLDRGGAETLVMNIYRKLDRSKVQFDFMVHGDKIGAYEEEIKSLGGKIYRMPPISLRTLLIYNRALKVFFKEHPEYRIVHAHNSELGNFVLRQAKLAGVPHRICHAHSSPQGLSFHNFLRNVFKLHTDLYTTDRFACSEIAGKWQFGDKKYEIIKNGIDTERFRYDEQLRKEMRNKLNLEDKFVIGHVGRFVEVKNHSFLLDVFKGILAIRKDAVLVLVGDGPLRHETENKAKQLGIDQNIRFMGVQENIPRFLNAFDVFVLPSIFEGAPVSVVEAQSTGLPCIISDNVSREIAITELCHFIPCHDCQKWIHAIIDITNNMRYSQNEKITRVGWDIIQTTKQLEYYYLNL